MASASGQATAYTGLARVLRRTLPPALLVIALLAAGTGNGVLPGGPGARGPVTEVRNALATTSVGITSSAARGQNSTYEKGDPIGTVSPQRDPAVRNVDRSGLRIQSVEIISTGWYVTGQDIRVKVTFDGNATVTGTPTLGLGIDGTVTADAAYESGSGAAGLVFKYTVRSTDQDANGISVPGPVYIPDGASVVDDFGNAPENLRIPSRSRVGNAAYHEVNSLPAVLDVTGDTSGLVPANLDASAGDVLFRLLFITSTRRTAQSADIGDYNKHVQDAAAGGHAAMNDDAIARRFRVIGSTPAVNAKTNTYEDRSDGVQVWWFRDGGAGDKAVNDYGSWYSDGDPEWLSQEYGNQSGGKSGIPSDGKIITGSDDTGTRAGLDQELGGSGSGVRTGKLENDGAIDAETANNKGFSHPGVFYALSQVFRVRDTVGPMVNNVALTSSVPTVGPAGARRSAYAIGEEIQVTVTFNGDVTPRSGQSIKLKVSNQVTAHYDSEATDSLRADSTDDDRDKKIVFSYTVREADTGGLISIPADGLSGDFRDAADNRAAAKDLEFAEVTTSQNVDTGRPSVDGEPGDPAAVFDSTGPYKANDVIRVRVRFTELVFVAVGPNAAKPWFPMLVGNRTVNAAYAGGDATAILYFEYAVQPGDSDDDGPSIAGGARVALNGAAIRDTNGNDADLTVGVDAVDAGAASYVDSTAPTIDSVKIAAKSGSDFPLGSGETLRVTVDFDEEVTVTGTPIVVVSFDVDKEAAYAATDPADGKIIHFDYVIEEGVTDADGPTIGEDQVSLDGGTIRDAVGNDADLTSDAVGARTNQVVDGEKPAVTITGPPDCGSPTQGADYNEGYKTCGIASAARVTITFTWSEPVDGFSAADVTVGAATKDGSMFTGTDGGKVYTIEITPTGAGSGSAGLDAITIDVAAEAATDEAGNGNRAAGVTHAPRPGPVRNIAVTGATSDGYTVTWDTPDFGGSGVSSYRFQAADDAPDFSADRTGHTVTGASQTAGDFTIQAVTTGDAKRSDLGFGFAVPYQARIAGIETCTGTACGPDTAGQVKVSYMYHATSANVPRENVVDYGYTPYITHVDLERCLADLDCDIEGSWVETRDADHALGTPGAILDEMPLSNGETVKYRARFKNALGDGEWSDAVEHTAPDTTAPAISVNNPSQTTGARSRVFSAIDDEPAGETAWRRLTTKNPAGCTDPFGPDTLSYTEGDGIIISRETDNDKHLCFWSTDSWKADGTGGNVGKAVSHQVTGIDTTAAGMTVNDPSQASPAMSRTFRATQNGGLQPSLVYRLQSSATCSSTYPGDGTDYPEATGVTLSAETDNDKHLCFWVKDGADNVTAVVSAQVVGIDRTAPTVTVTNPDQAALGSSRVFSATVSDPTPSGLTDAANAIAFVYRIKSPPQDDPGAAAFCEDGPVGRTTRYTAGQGIEFDDEADNNKWLCFWATDTAGNAGKANSDKVARLDTRAPTIAVTFQAYDFDTMTLTDTTRQDETRNRLVRASATDASTVGMWYRVQSSSSCTAAQLDENARDIHRYDGAYADTLFTAAAPVVVRENSRYVCFWARDGAARPNIASRVSSRVRGVVGPPVIVVSNPRQTSIAISRAFSARDNFVGASTWGWKLVDSEAACVSTLTGLADYTEGDPVVFRDNDDNGKLVCFVVADDKVDDAGNPTPDKTVKPSAAIANIEVTPIAVVVTNPDQANSADERVFSAKASTGDANRAGNWRYKVVDTVDTTARYPCGGEPPRDARSYRPGDPVTVTRSTDNGKHVCFWTRDSIGNVGNGASARITGIQPPTVTITYTTTDPAAHTASAEDDVTGRTTMRYQIVDSDTDCAVPVPRSGTTSYREGREITLDDETHNGRRLCFWTADGDGDVGTASQAIAGIDTDPVITVRGNNGTNRSIISAIDQQDDSAWKIQLYDRDEEDATYGAPPEDAEGNLACAAAPPSGARDYTEGESKFNDGTNDVSLSFPRWDNNRKWICFWTEDDGDAASVLVTVTVSGGGGGGGGRSGNEHPEFEDGSSTSRSVAENTPEGTPMGPPVAATDEDRDTLAYVIKGDDASFFAVDGASGQLLTRAPLDHEARDSYRLWMDASDRKGGIDTIRVDITVTNVDEAPVLMGDSVIDYPEGGRGDAAAYTAADPEEAQVAWALTGDDAGAFSIDTGDLSFRTPPDFEAPADADEDNVYTLTVEASDGTGAASLDVAIAVTDVDEGPVLTWDAAIDYAEGGAGDVGTYTAIDPEGDDIAWTLTGDDAGSFSIGGGTLSFRAPPDFEAPGDANGDNVYSVTVEASDGTGAASLDVTITVTDVDLGSPYDTDANEVIDKDEAISATVDYFAGLIDKDEAISVIVLYFLG